MKIAIITPCELSYGHGTGAQILQLTNNVITDFHHFHWNFCHGDHSDVFCSTFLWNGEVNIPKLRHLTRFVLRGLGISWWNGTTIKKRKFRRFLKARGLQFDVAYILVGEEDGAQKALSVVREMGCPYVLHVMDIMDEAGLDPATMPGFRQLTDEASSALSLNIAINQQMQKLTSKPILNVFVGQPETVAVAQTPASSQIRIVMGGRPYQDGCVFLAEAFPALKRLSEVVQLIHIGPHYKDLPAELKKVAEDAGFLEEADYRLLLSTAHLAYLSGPSELDCFGKFSFPSRCSDYLMAGLPVLAHIAEGSATRQILAPLIPETVAVTNSVDQFCQAVGRFTADTVSWSQASAKAREFALQNMNIENTRRQIEKALTGAKV